MQTLMFVLSLLVICTPVILLIGGMSPRAEKAMDNAVAKYGHWEYTVPITIWACNLIAFVMIAGLALGKYGFKILG